MEAGSAATTPGCADEERCLTDKVAGGRGKGVPGGHGIRQRWGAEPSWRLLPRYTLALSLAQVLVYVCASDSLTRSVRFEPSLRHEAWRFLTYSLVHHGPLHLGLNLLVQLLLGWPLEVEQGPLRTCAVYAAGALGGALGACVLQPQPMLGASAGIYALLISHLAHLYLNLGSLKYKVYRIFSVFVLATSDIIFFIFHTRSESSPDISLSAHAIGGLSGLFLGLIVYRSEEKGKELQFKVVRWTAFVLTTILIAVGIVLICVLPSEFFRR